MEHCWLSLEVDYSYNMRDLVEFSSVHSKLGHGCFVIATPNLVQS